jgi:hypothetical protein
MSKSEPKKLYYFVPITRHTVQSIFMAFLCDIFTLSDRVCVLNVLGGDANLLPSLYFLSSLQSRQNTRLFLTMGTLACGRGGGGIPILTRGQTLWCSRGMCMYFVLFPHPPPPQPLPSLPPSCWVQDS